MEDLLIYQQQVQDSMEVYIHCVKNEYNTVRALRDMEECAKRLYKHIQNIQDSRTPAY